MAGLSLLALLDDIAAVLDDVALMTKVAAKKTAGVLGDDLALNAKQVSGVRAERELPVVWAVAKGSFWNKVILVPSALALSVFLPQLMIGLLMIGGAYLCFEGFEKVFHALFHRAENNEHEDRIKAISDPDVDLVAFEKDKIKGAIRTDFILSAEIIVIALGTVSESIFMTQVMVVAGIALIMTVGVYGLVAGIVKIDDAGIYLIERAEANGGNKFQDWIGRGLLAFAPILMKFLVIVGTAAMFLVGGGIILHGIPWLAEFGHHIDHMAGTTAGIGPFLAVVSPILTSAVVGIITGGIVLVVVNIVMQVVTRFKSNDDVVTK